MRTLVVLPTYNEGENIAWIINALLYVVFVAGYSVILVLLRIATLSEVTVLGRAFCSKNALFDGSKSVRKEYLDG